MWLPGVGQEKAQGPCVCAQTSDWDHSGLSFCTGYKTFAACAPVSNRPIFLDLRGLMRAYDFTVLRKRRILLGCGQVGRDKNLDCDRKAVQFSHHSCLNRGFTLRNLPLPTPVETVQR